MMNDELLNEKSEFKKIKLNFPTFNVHTLSHSLVPKKYYGILHQSEGPEISNFLVWHMSRYLIYQPKYDSFSKTGPNHVFSSPNLNRYLYTRHAPYGSASRHYSMPVMGMPGGILWSKMTHEGCLFDLHT